MRKITIVIILTFLFFTGCSKVGKVTEVSKQGSYVAALMWNSDIYSPGNSVVISESSIDSELGRISKQVLPMPKRDGEINDISNFAVGDKILSIKNIETTEAIAIMSNGKYFRIDRIRSSSGVVWDNKIYDFVGNFAKENEKANLAKEVGQIRRVGIDYKNADNGDITTLGYMGDLSIFQVGGKISLLQGTNSNKAIAVEDKDGKFHKAVYVKKINK
jgi:PBP1b-binding outer membrane lipoprotein LpoB